MLWIMVFSLYSCEHLSSGLIPETEAKLLLSSESYNWCHIRKLYVSVTLFEKHIVTLKDFTIIASF